MDEPLTISVRIVGYPPAIPLVEHLRRTIGRTRPVWVSCRESYAFWCEHPDAWSLDLRDAGMVSEITTPCVLVDPDQATVDAVIREANADIEVYVFDGRKPPHLPPSVMTICQRIGEATQPPELSPAL